MLCITHYYVMCIIFNLILLFHGHLRLYVQIFNYFWFTPSMLHHHSAKSLINTLKWAQTHKYIRMSVRCGHTYRCSISLWRYMYIYVYIEMCLCVYVCMYWYVCMYARVLYIYIHIYIHTHLCTCTTCIHTYVRTYIRTYIHTYIRTSLHTGYLLTNSLFTYSPTYLLHHH